MPVSLPLNGLQMTVLQQAMRAAKIEAKTNGRHAEMTADNVVPIREAVKSLHAKKLAVKNKTAEHLEICYTCQELLERINGLNSHFPALNDNEAVVAVEEETVEEEVIEEAEVEEEVIAESEDNDSEEPNRD